MISQHPLGLAQQNHAVDRQCGIAELLHDIPFGYVTFGQITFG
jgi:hypothetical protein